MGFAPFVTLWQNRVCENEYPTINNLWIVHTLKVWNLIQKQLKGAVTLSRAMPIAGNIEFLPSMYDRAYKQWAETGLIIINQLLDGQVFKSFSQLRDKFDLPLSDLYTVDTYKSDIMSQKIQIEKKYKRNLQI